MNGVGLRCPCVTEFGFASASIPCGNRPLKRPRAIQNGQRRSCVIEFGSYRASLCFPSVLSLRPLFLLWLKLPQASLATLSKEGGVKGRRTEQAQDRRCRNERKRSRKVFLLFVKCALSQAHFPFLLVCRVC